MIGMTSLIDCQRFGGSFTDDELNATYTGGLLPATYTGGLLPATNTASLKNSGVISYDKATQITLLNNIKSEYCFYYVRYRYILDKLFTFLKDNSMAVTTTTTEKVTLYSETTNVIGLTETQLTPRDIPTKTTTIIEADEVKYKGYTATARMLNSKLISLSKIINDITAEFLKMKTANEDAITKFNEEIKTNQNKLIEQNNIISSNQSKVLLHKEMVKYTEEKNKYTDNLLKVYSVLNIVVLGLLVYVYKSVN